MANSLAISTIVVIRMPVSGGVSDVLVSHGSVVIVSCPILRVITSKSNSLIQSAKPVSPHIFAIDRNNTTDFSRLGKPIYIVVHSLIGRGCLSIPGFDAGTIKTIKTVEDGHSVLLSRVLLRDQPSEDTGKGD
jgi:hypothetical protein